MVIGNRPQEAGRYDDREQQLPRIYQAMIEQLAKGGGEAVMQTNGDITIQSDTHTGAGRLAGTHMDWLRCVAWGMVEGRDGTILRLTNLGRTRTQKSGTPAF